MPDYREREQALVFVYNADAGLGSAILDIGHKVISPGTYDCRLCALTHGLFTMRGAWRQFVQKLPVAVEFLHRDQFRARYGMAEAALPAVFLRQGDGTVEVLLPAEAVVGATSLEDLEARLTERLGAVGLAASSPGPTGES